jgi:hypothetical protein
VGESEKWDLLKGWQDLREEPDGEGEEGQESRVKCGRGDLRVGPRQLRPGMLQAWMIQGMPFTIGLHGCCTA